MASMTFQVNDSSTSGGYPAVWVTITENSDGTLSFTITQEGGIIGDLRGLFFDVADESLIGTLQTDAQTTDFRQGDDSIKDLGDGANMNGLLGSDKGYDAGIEVGSAGIGKDDIQSYSFTLSSTARALTLQDFANVDFGVRLTSVGTIDGSRSDSSKIMENTSVAIDAHDDSACVDENATASGNVLANDATSGGTTTVTGWTGGDLGEAVTLSSTKLDVTVTVSLTLNADGSWTLDAMDADALSADEHLEYTFSYSARNQTEATSWSDDTATFTVCVDGQNDGPVANDDNGGSVNENVTLTGNVTGNDSDVDRLDTHTYSLLQEWTGPGELTFNEDGTWSYNSGDLADLNDGQDLELSFQYQMADNHGGTDTATVTFVVQGVGGGGGGGGGGDPVDPALTFLFNHGSNEYEHGWFPQLGDNTAEGFTDNDTLKIAGYGDADDLTIYEGDYGLGDPTVDDTYFVIGIDGNRNSTRTEDSGYLVDYTGLTAGQIDVTGNSDITIIYG